MTAPRLHVIPAIGCAKALILRRGPTDEVASLLWERSSDQFEMGQWLRGRIYEHRCDISPDGRHMVIFARKPDVRIAWTSLSRTPWLRAIAFWPQESTMHGGGAFCSEGRLWLNGSAPEKTALPDDLAPADVDAYPHSTDGFHMGDLYAATMTYRGWTHIRGARYGAVLIKRLTDNWHLELSFNIAAKNRAIISNIYTLVNEAKSQRISQNHWEWADTFEGKVQFASNGCLCDADLNTDGNLDNPRVIRDFSDMKFMPIKAPYEGCGPKEPDL